MDLKSALRTVKTYTKGNETKTKVRQGSELAATCSDAWGPSGLAMNEISQLTYNQDSFIEVVEALDKRLNDKGKNWRHVFKSLTVIDYLLHAGSENVVLYFKDNVYVIKTLKEFQYIDEEGKDQGANVRKKAADISNLLLDEARLRRERRARAHMRERMIRGAADGPDGEELLRLELQQSEDDDVRRVMKAHEKAEAEKAKAEEQKALEEAMRSSASKEVERAKAVAATNGSTLFDDQPLLSPITPQISHNPFPFTDPGLYTTSLIPSSQTQLQPQFTSMQPQFTSFNPYQQQLHQADLMRQQQEWNQQAMFEEQRRLQQEQMIMLQQQAQIAAMHQQQQQQQLVPQPTGFGSRNPFAPAARSSSPLPSSPFPSQQQQQCAPPSFNHQGTFEYNNRSQSSSQASTTSSNARSPTSPSSPSFPPTPTSNSAPSPPATMPSRQPSKADQEHGNLANLFANRVDDGTDTFGNHGALRYGPTSAGRVVQQQQKMENNPFTSSTASQQPPALMINDERPFF